MVVRKLPLRGAGGEDPACPNCPGSRGRLVPGRRKLDRSAGLAPRLRQRGGRGRRIDEAAGEEIEREQLEEDGQEQQSSGRRENGQRRNGLGQIDQLLAHLRLLLARQRSSGRGFRQELSQLARLADLLQEPVEVVEDRSLEPGGERIDRKSTRLNSSHRCTSYAVFCLKKKMT